MLVILNYILILYFVPLLVAYLMAKVYYTFTDLYDEHPGLFAVLATLIPGLNILAAMFYLVIGTAEFLGNGVDWSRRKGNKTIGERFFKIKRGDG